MSKKEKKNSKSSKKQIHYKVAKILKKVKKIKSLISKIPKVKKIKEKIKESKSKLNVKLTQGIVPKQFEVITPDGIDIKLNFYDTPNTNKGIILLPMLGKTKESMDSLAQFVCKLGFKAVAVDYRGHGGSELNWQSFR